MKKSVLLLAALVICAPTLSFADDTTPATAPASGNDPDQIVCRKGEPITGTRLPGRTVCHTQRDWDQIERDSQGVTTQMQTNGNLHNPQSK
ncbi:MAG TPA: hypothetical protein VIJ62_07305 [Rhizomicrobium sp.]